MTRFFSFQNGRIAVFGDTYSLRSRLKEQGGRWSAEQKCWLLPQNPNVVAQLMELGFKDPSATSSPSAEVTRKPSLAEANNLRAFEPPDLSVSQLCDAIRSALERHVPAQFWVVGELCEARQSRGHFWLEVADAQESGDTLVASDGAAGDGHRTVTRKAASVSAVIWSGVLRRLTARAAPQELPLQVGLKIRFLAHAEFRPDGGRIQVIVDDVDLSYTQGQLALSREQILQELRRRGLIDRNQQTTLAAFPLRIALITADQSRARNDFLHELETSGIGFETTLVDCRMQGEQTSADVCSALGWLNQTRTFAADVIVITRGGGSRMDLRWFDDLEIAKSVAYARVPVITAIGHHEDVSVADAVAWQAEKTPTAAARLLVQRCRQSEAEVLSQMTHAGQRALRRVQAAAQMLLSRVARASQLALRRTVAAEQALLNTSAQITRSAFLRIERERARLDQNERILRLVKGQLSKGLVRGFALVRTFADTGSPSRLLRAEDFLESNAPSEVAISLATKDGRRRVSLRARIESMTEETLGDD